MAASIESLNQRMQVLESERSSWDTHWQDIRDYLLPHRGRWLARGDKSNYGDKRMSKIIMSQASRSLKMLAAGMQGGLTSPSRPWFKLGLNDAVLEEAPAVKVWLSDTERRIYTALARSNFYSAAHEMYMEEAGFGTGVLFMDDVFPLGMPYHTLTVGEYLLGASETGQVDSMYRRLWMTAKQIAQQFGLSTCSDNVKKASEDNPFQYFKVNHAIQPREIRQSGKADALNKAWESVWWEDGQGEKALFESGFEELPFVSVRWETVSLDSYGRGPGMEILPDVKMLQSMAKQHYNSIAMVNNPPMAVPGSLLGKLNLTPGGINKVDPGQSGDVIKPIYQINPDIQHMMLAVQDVREQIKQGFFNDLFITLSDVPAGMTATEVMERHAEKLLLLGPIVERMQWEFLDPLIERNYKVLFRNQQLLPPPQELSGQQVRIEYTSLLAQAQREVSVQGLTKMVNFVAQVAQVAPQAVDKLNADAMIDQGARAFGVPPEVIVPTQMAQQIRQQRMQAQAQAMQQQQAAENQKAAAQAIGQIGNMSTEPGTVAGDMMQGMGGQGPESQPQGAPA